MNFFDELQWRGLIQDHTPETKDKLTNSKIKGYIGFDPTADSLHIGSLVPIIILKHFQNYGHTPVVLVGGATGMVGDPSGKSQERNLLDKETLDHNLNAIKIQLSQFLQFDQCPNAAIIVNNYDWFKNYFFLDFIRDIGKHITVNYMLAKDSVKKRLESESGMSFTEFSYQLVQGYDFYWLFQHLNCELQMGGADQWGNITTGTELIRKMTNKPCFALTSPLVTKADGTKFGKSEKGNIWLDANKTSPYSFYQFWLNTSDIDAETWIKYFTFLSQEKINELVELHRKSPHERILQRNLAQEITIFVHGENSLLQAQQTSEILFGENNHAIFNEVEEWQILAALEGMPIVHLSEPLPYPILELLIAAGVCPSKSEGRKLIQNQGLKINKKKIEINTELQIHSADLIKNKFLLIQKGKKNYYLVCFS